METTTVENDPIPTAMELIECKEDVPKFLEQTNLTNDEQVEEYKDDQVIEGSINKSTQRKKNLRILDSDDDEKVETTTNDNQKTSNPDHIQRAKMSALIDSESEDGTELKADADLNALQNKYSKKSMNSLLDTENEDEEVEMNQRKISTLIDSESDAEMSDADENSKQLEDCNDDAMPKTQTESQQEKPKIIRASAKKAMDEMQAIQSEQQRLHREAHLSIPYHKPKKYTLQEFLQRRTIIKPQIQSNDSPVVVQRKSLKMTPEELEEYANLMEERAKEATEFFKSESEQEDEELKDNLGVLDISNEVEQTHAADEEVLNIETPMTSRTEEENALSSLNLLPSSKEIVEDLQEGMPVTSKVVITEVLELPKLDFNIDMVSMPTNLRSSKNIKQIIAEQHLHESPTLKGDPNMLIDLESGDLIAKAPSLADNLLERLIATHKVPKAKTSNTLKILSTENGKLEISKINVKIKEEDNPQKEQKPGAGYVKLKENLKWIINEKRREDMRKKLNEEIEYNKCLEDDDEDEEEYEPETKPPTNEANFEEIAIDEDENASSLNNNQYNALEENIDGAAEEVDEESEMENKGSEDSDDDDDDTEDDEKELVESEKTDEIKATENIKIVRNRIIQPFQDDSDDDEEEVIVLKQPPPVVSSLFELEPKKNQTEELTELLGLCSGEFLETQKSNGIGTFISQIPSTQTQGAKEAAEELLQLCSGDFEDNKNKNAIGNDLSQIPVVAPASIAAKTTHKTVTKILSSDEEQQPNEVQENEKKRTKRFTKKTKKTKIKLGFSDDEDSSDSDEQIDTETDALLGEQATEVDADLPETFIDYDSEENEIVVQMTKNERVQQAQKFFENEAELSESNWGSADEDENAENMNNYDIELGDEDEFDRDKLRTELGQIHARKMLDEDIREVRILQEMFFEDEENDGVGRNRQFKWKNAESGFSLDDGIKRDENEERGADGESGDEENEQTWRKIRFEREQFVFKNSQNQTTSTLISSTTASSENLATAAGTARKMNIITATKTTSNEAKKSSPFLISKLGTSASANAKKVRGSFLVRDRETLNKLADLTKTRSDANGATASVSANSKNFVFTTLTVEEHENLKRKADDLISNSSDNGVNYMKKPKIVPRRDKCLIDQLL